MNDHSLLATILSIACCATTAHAQTPNQPTKDFWQAARTGDVERVKQLLAEGVDVDAVTEFNCGAVYFAANRNQAAVIDVLVEAGADVSLRDTDYGFTPVQMAAWLGHTEATAALIEAGASKNDVIGSCFAAAGNGHAETVKLIVEKMDMQSQLNALWGTAKNTGNPNVCRVLEELGAEPQPKSDRDSEEDEEERAEEASETETNQPPAFDFESDQPLSVAQVANWPAFRGPGRSGIADGQHPPAAFDLDSGRNIKWQSPVEGLGLSSPIIWDGRIYVTTATSSATKQSIEEDGRGWIEAVSEDVPHRWNLLCYDLQTGQLVWERTVCEGIPKSKRHWKASHANSTCATDGKHLIVLFGSEGIYCYDLAGNLLWRQDLGRLDAGWYIDSTFPWGFASSPVIYDDSVIIQCDVFERPFITALRLTDGQPIWRAEREDELSSWGTPLVVASDQRVEVVTNASKAVRSYDARSGELLWFIQGNSPITVASPVAADGLIVATGGYKKPKPIYVVQTGKANGELVPDEDGNAEGMVWSQQDDGVYIVTPLLYRGHLYLCDRYGVLTVYDANTGAQQYEKRLPTGGITASPVVADGRIYFVGEDGRVVVLNAGDAYDEIARSELNESTLATPAVSNGTIVFRTVKGLVAVAHDRI